MNSRMILRLGHCFGILALTIFLAGQSDVCFAQKTVTSTTVARFRVVVPLSINGMSTPSALLTLRSAQEYAADEIANVPTTPPELVESADTGRSSDEIVINSSAQAMEVGGRLYMRIDGLDMGDANNQHMIVVALTGN